MGLGLNPRVVVPSSCQWCHWQAVDSAAKTSSERGKIEGEKGNREQVIGGERPAAPAFPFQCVRAVEMRTLPQGHPTVGLAPPPPPPAPLGRAPAAPSPTTVLPSKKAVPDDCRKHGIVVGMAWFLCHLTVLWSQGPSRGAPLKQGLSAKASVKTRPWLLGNAP